MYSQNEEEKWIAESFSDKSAGILLDIGAYDGITFSNSLALIERGWLATLVEPSQSFAALSCRHSKNPNVSLVRCLVGTRDDVVPFWDSPDMVATSTQYNHEVWKEVGQFSPAVYMPQITIRTLVRALPYLRGTSFLSIDAEGQSADIFFSIPWDLINPKCICIEFDDKEESIKQEAESRGYKVSYQSSENLVLVR